MAQSATAERPNKVKITDAGPCKKQIHIEIPAETVAEQLGSSIDTLLVEAELPGFRKGRAPRRLVEKKFGSTIRSEAKNQLVASAYSKAVEEHKLRVVGDPVSEELPKMEIVDGKPLSFTIEVEVLPEFELPNLDGIEVKKPTVAVSEEMVSKEFDRLLLNEGRLEPKEKVEKGDYLTGHAVMTDEEGKRHLDIQDAVVQVPPADKGGKGMILGVMVDDFADQLKLPKAGSTVTIKTTGPENHETEALRGKKLTITFEVKRADEIIAADPAEVAKRYGLDKPEELKEALRKRIEQRVEVEQQTAMRQQIAKFLLESTKMELPERLTANQALRNLERRRLDLMHRGVDGQAIEENIAQLRNASAGEAAAELKLFFIMDKVAEKFDVKVNDAEMNQRIAQIAFSRGERPERLRQEIINRNQVGMIYQQIREHKAMDQVLSRAKVTELGADEFNKAMEAEAKSARAAAPKKDEGEAKPKKAAAKKDDEGEEKPKASKGKKKGE
jgi:trigger factor